MNNEKGKRFKQNLSREGWEKIKLKTRAEMFMVPWFISK
jgi:hypothetical protein